MCTETERNSADDSLCCRIHNESVQHGVAREEEEDLKDDSLIANKLWIVGIYVRAKAGEYTLTTHCFWQPPVSVSTLRPGNSTRCFWFMCAMRS